MVSVIIINYLRPLDVIECIKSIKLNLKKIPHEIIVVVNDNHKFDSIENVHFELSTENLGVAGGRNLGASLANYEWLFFIDDDAVLAKYSLKLDDIDNDIGIISVISKDYCSKKLRKHENPRKNKKYSSKYIGVGHFIRKSIFTACGGYDIISKYGMEEYNFQYKAFNKGVLIGNSEVEVLHKKKDQGRSKDQEKKSVLARTKLKLIAPVVPIEIYFLHLIAWSTRMFFLTGKIGLNEIEFWPKYSVPINRINFYRSALKCKSNVFY